MKIYIQSKPVFCIEEIISGIYTHFRKSTNIFLIDVALLQNLIPICIILLIIFFFGSDLVSEKVKHENCETKWKVKHKIKKRRRILRVESETKRRVKYNEKK